MRDEDKTKKMLTEELAALRRQLADLKSHTSPDSRQIEDELRESRMLFSTTINTMVDILVCMDLEGKILFINDYALQVSGYSREEIEGKNMLSFIAPEDHARIIENTIRMMGKKLGPQEYNLLMKDGSIIPFEVNGDVLWIMKAGLSALSMSAGISPIEKRLRKKSEKAKSATGLL